MVGGVAMVGSVNWSGRRCRGRMVTPAGRSSWSSGQWVGCWAMGPPRGSAGRPLRTLDRMRIAGEAMPAGGLAAAVVGERRDSVVVALVVAVLLAGLHPRQRARGLAPCMALLGVGVAGRLGAERTVRVGDLEALAIVLHRSGGLPPRAAATHRLGHRPE